MRDKLDLIFPCGYEHTLTFDAIKKYYQYSSLLALRLAEDKQLIKFIMICILI